MLNKENRQLKERLEQMEVEIRAQRQIIEDKEKSMLMFESVGRGYTNSIIDASILDVDSSTTADKESTTAAEAITEQALPVLDGSTGPVLEVVVDSLRRMLKSLSDEPHFKQLLELCPASPDTLMETAFSSVLRTPFFERSKLSEIQLANEDWKSELEDIFNRLQNFMLTARFEIRYPVLKVMDFQVGDMVLFLMAHMDNMDKEPSWLAYNVKYPNFFLSNTSADSIEKITSSQRTYIIARLTKIVQKVFPTRVLMETTFSPI